MIQNVEIAYEDTAPAHERESLFAKSLQMWLRPFSEEINRQNGKLVLVFGKDGSNKFRLENVDEALRNRIAEQFPKFVSHT